jgi:transcriptional regulator with XRE-family HTH domain
MKARTNTGYSLTSTINSLREFIVKIRKEKNITQAELAEKVGVRVATISDYETGKSSINADVIEKIFKILDVRIEPDANREKQFEDAGNVAKILFEKGILSAEKLTKKELYDLTQVESILALSKNAKDERDTYEFFQVLVKFHIVLLKIQKNKFNRIKK